jgi:hypothetical protein
MSFFRAIGLVCFLALFAVLAGCHSTGGGNQPPSQPGEEAWIRQFKNTLNRTEQRFNDQRYIQQSEDPFDLEYVISRAKPNKPFSQALRNQLEQRVDDYHDSWSVLDMQLRRTQTIFAVTSVLPAYDATLLLSKAVGELKVESIAVIYKFKEALKNGSLFNPILGELEISPEARADLMDLARDIVKKTLVEIKTLPVANLTSDEQDRLRESAVQMAILNPVAATDAGEATNNPETAWNSLDRTYKTLFGKLEGAARLSSDDLVEIRRLQADEKQYLGKVLETTDRQFKLARKLSQ